MHRGELGLMAQPGNGIGPGAAPGVPWAGDNACFADRWTASWWLGWLERQRDYGASCLFAVVPDVVADHAATLERWHQWWPAVAALGFRPAFVLQDGLEDPAGVPWDDVGAVFIGGTTAYKLSDTAHAIALEARRRGTWVHMGRVNSLRRLTYAAPFCDSVDGTFLRFAPDHNLRRLRRYLHTAHQRANQVGLF